ncbi:OPG biosynthetic periplasmic beta-1,6 branching glycosyltransferase [Methylobacterium sp.]|nr:OPG biosynthetic periplasmic beta-1,6 branching glycosyltransferase [Methylobacterium sp.]
MTGSTGDGTCRDGRSTAAASTPLNSHGPVPETDPPSRRAVLRTALTAAAGTLLPSAIDLNAARTMAAGSAEAIAARGEAGPMTFEALTSLAEGLGAAPYAPAPDDLPADLARLDYDAYRMIRFRKDAAPKLGRHYSVQLFHRGFLQRKRVDLFLQPRDGAPRRLGYASGQFDLGKPLEGKSFPPELGFAGFRLHYAFERGRPDFQEEFLVFLGASYFRVRGRTQEYGLSARGIAVGTGLPAPEEFPDFTAHWICEPDESEKSLTILSLLDGPSLSGAYRFVVEPGDTTRITVTAALFPRKRIERLGLAPLTSMFQYGQNGPGVRGAQPFDDFRPEVHDSDGLVVATPGERLWRPLVNERKATQVSSFSADPLTGFGLLQRQRDFMAYLDVQARHEARPGLYVEPVPGRAGNAGFGPGAVQLLEIPSREEWVDNIVASFVPKDAIEPGRRLALDYTLTTVGEEPAPGLSGELARVVSARSGSAERLRPLHPPQPNRRFYAIDFAGARLPRNADAAVTAVVSASTGQMVEPIVEVVPQIGGWRLYVEWRPPKTLPPGDVVLRAHLVLDRRPVSETWDAVAD